MKQKWYWQIEMKGHHHKKILILILIFLMSSSIGIQAQKDYGFKYDTNYITNLSDKLSIRVLGINKFNKFSIINNDNDQEIQFEPNSNLNLGFGVNYKWFGLAVAFNFPFVNNDNHIYGETNRFDFQLNIFARKFVVDFYLQSYQGFYIANPDSYIPTWEPGMAYPIRPDIKTTAIGGNYLYVFNDKKYSGQAAFNQTEMQKKSAGSFLLGGSVSFFSIAGDSMFIPSVLSDLYNEDLHFKEIDVSVLGIMAGYTHTFVLWKKFYITLSFIPGISVQGYKIGYPDASKDKDGSIVAGNYLVKTAFVYNSKRSFAGITANNGSFYGYASKQHNTNLVLGNGAVRFFYGRRFNIYPKKSQPK